MKIIHKHCDHCQEETKFCIKNVSHIMHFVLTVLTVGFWIAPWLIISLNSKMSQICVECENTAGFSGVMKPLPVRVAGQQPLGRVGKRKLSTHTHDYGQRL